MRSCPGSRTERGLGTSSQQQSIKQFPLHSLLSIVFVQEPVQSSCGLERRTSCPVKGVSGTRLSSTFEDFEFGHFGFLCFTLIKMVFSAYRLLLTRRWKLVEVYLLVLLSFTALFCYIPCSSTSMKISSQMVCKSTYMYDEVTQIFSEIF